jgi:hypothetical protein
MAERDVSVTLDFLHHDELRALRRREVDRRELSLTLRKRFANSCKEAPL